LTHPRLRKLLWIAILAIQIGVPLGLWMSRAGNPVENLLGWQMYSTGGGSAVVWCAGELVEVDRDDWLDGACR